MDNLWEKTHRCQLICCQFLISLYSDAWITTKTDTFVSLCILLQYLYGTMYSQSTRLVASTSSASSQCTRYLKISDGSIVQRIEQIVCHFWSRRDIDYAVSLAHTSLRLCPSLGACAGSLHHFLDLSSNYVWGDELWHPTDLLAPVQLCRNMRRESRINVRDRNYIYISGT